MRDDLFRARQRRQRLILAASAGFGFVPATQNVTIGPDALQDFRLAPAGIHTGAKISKGSDYVVTLNLSRPVRPPAHAQLVITSAPTLTQSVALGSSTLYSATLKNNFSSTVYFLSDNADFTFAPGPTEFAPAAANNTVVLDDGRFSFCREAYRWVRGRRRHTSCSASPPELPRRRALTRVTLPFRAARIPMARQTTSPRRNSRRLSPAMLPRFPKRPHWSRSA